MNQDSLFVRGNGQLLIMRFLKDRPGVVLLAGNRAEFENLGFQKLMVSRWYYSDPGIPGARLVRTPDQLSEYLCPEWCKDVTFEETKALEIFSRVEWRGLRVYPNCWAPQSTDAAVFYGRITSEDLPLQKDYRRRFASGDIINEDYRSAMYHEWLDFIESVRPLGFSCSDPRDYSVHGPMQISDCTFYPGPIPRELLELAGWDQ